MTDSLRRTPPLPAVSPVTTQSARSAAILGWLAAAGIGGSILIMIGASLVRQAWMFPPLPTPEPGPPWEVHLAHVPAGLVIVGLWAAAVLAAGGLAAGLLAASKGARPSMRLILIAAVVAVAALTVLPPAGSTDALDYAAYGRLLVLGHNPYVTTPHFLRATHDAFAQSVPTEWQRQVSLYGPFATLEQFLAAKLGGISAARVVFWLKLWNSIAFGGVAVVLDRLLRSDPAQRLRAHLLWTLNPLLLWDLIAAGHVDVLAAAAGLIGLLAIGRQAPSVRPRLTRGLAAGALVGIAADIKINYILFAVALAWALRRSPAALATAAGGALGVLIPTYAWLGAPAARALLARRDKVSADTPYRLLFPDAGHIHNLVLLATVIFVLLAILVLRRMPPGDLLRPALRPALAISVAWLFVWPYQLPWYDAIIICVLVLYPASRLDWLVLARLTAATISNMPGNAGVLPGHLLLVIDQRVVLDLAPLVLLLAAVGLVTLAVSGRWGLRGPATGPAADDGSPGNGSPGSGISGGGGGGAEPVGT
jgi:hypothetical protein